jgi:hypothetical protein
MNNIFKGLRTRRAFTLFCFLVLSGSILAHAQQISSDQKAKVKGTIVSRSGDLVSIYDKKAGTKAIVDVTDTTLIERKHGKAEFFRHKDMDVTALVPGLTIEAEGVGNAKGQLVAKKISFTPDEFAIEVAEEQQIRVFSRHRLLKVQRIRRKHPRTTPTIMPWQRATSRSWMRRQCKW